MFACIEKADGSWELCRPKNFPPDVRAGIAPTRFVAEIALEFAHPHLVVKDMESFLAPLSISYLPIDEEMERKLHLLGIETMGGLQQFGRADLAALFGREGHLVWELCRGLDDRPLISEEEEETNQVVVPIEEWGPQALEPLFGKLCKQLVVIWGEKQLKVNFCHGVRDAKKAFSQIEARMQGKRWPEVEEIRVVVTETVEPKSEQLVLFGKRSHLFPEMFRVVWDEPQSRLPERWAHLENDEMRRPLLKPRMRRVRGEVLERWEVKEDWWSDPIERSYRRILTANGGYVRTFCEKGVWYAH